MFYFKGISVEAICSSIRHLSLMQKFSHFHQIVLVCHLDKEIKDAIKVNVVSI